MTPRQMRRAAQRGAVLRSVKALGCTCKPWVKPTGRDEYGIPHVGVAHDDDCPLLHAPSVAVLYGAPRCER
jgi:hypothetical protein